MFVQGKRRSSSYLKEGRVADVLALIQVLALHEHAYRSEEGVTSELQGPPKSGENWSEIAKRHPEFFRVNPAKQHSVSLVARHTTPEQNTRPPLSADYTSKLMNLAVELHDRELRRAERWHIWVPIIVAATAGAFTLFGIWLKSVLGGS